MILQNDKNLADYLIEILAKRRNFSVLEMRKNLSEIGKKYTIQAIYKELKRLQDGGIVVKSAKNYGLRIPWVLDLSFFVDEMRANYLEKYSTMEILPSVGKREVWKFTNLLRLNDFWSQILLTLINQSKNKILLGYNPHLWFHLVQTEQELQYLKSIGLAKGRLYLIVGSRDYLDKWAEKFFDKKTVEHSYAKSFFEVKNFGYINVIDDFVLTVKIDQKTSENIDKLYKRTKSIDEINISEILKIFNNGIRANIQLEKNPEKAEGIKKKFANYFGINF